MLRHFTKLKLELMPYILEKAREACEHGIPVMRSMHLEFPDDPACAYLDQQYMLGDRYLVSPVFSPSGRQKFYLPAGEWREYFSGEIVQGGRWLEETYDYFSLPLYERLCK